MKKIFLNILFGITIVSLNACADSKKNMNESQNAGKSKTTETEKINIQSNGTYKALQWMNDVHTAFEKAREQQKNLMVMAEDPHCRWCVKMEEEALSDERVQKYLREYILLKIERSDNKSMESLPGLRGPIPSFHFFTADKKFIDKVAGYYKTEDFLDYIKEIAEDGL